MLLLDFFLPLSLLCCHGDQSLTYVDFKSLFLTILFRSGVINEKKWIFFELLKISFLNCFFFVCNTTGSVVYRIFQPLKYGIFSYEFYEYLIIYFVSRT